MGEPSSHRSSVHIVRWSHAGGIVRSTPATHRVRLRRVVRQPRDDEIVSAIEYGRLRMPRMVIALLTLAVAPTIARFAYAQGTAADYARAPDAAERIDRATIDVPEAPTWLLDGRFWYRKSVRGGTAFVLVDAATGRKSPAFDHARVASALSDASGGQYTAGTLPFRSITFADSNRAIDVVVDSIPYRCLFTDGTCAKQTAQFVGGRGRGGGRGNSDGARQSFGGGLYGNEAPVRTASKMSPD